MNTDSKTDATERDLFWLKTWISDNVALLGFLAFAALIGHKTFGLPDVGVTPLHLLAMGVGGAFIILVGIIVVGRRSRKRLVQELRRSGFDDREIEEQLRSLDH